MADTAPSTASIAASVISEMSGDSGSNDASTPNASTEAIAAHAPHIIASEVDSLNDGSDNRTHRIAAVEVSRQNEKPWTITREGNLRREHHATSRTEQIAREVLDLAAAMEGVEIDPRDRRDLALADFIAAHNSQLDVEPLPIGALIAEPGSDAWREAVESALDQMIAQSRERKR